MRIFLFGGTQASALICAERMNARGHEVTALVESAAAGDAYRALGAEAVVGSPLKLPPFEEGLAKRDVAVFFGTDMPHSLRPSTEELRPYERVRTDGMRTFVAAALRQRTPLALLVSSVVVYGDCGDRTVTEQQPINAPRPAASFADMEGIFGEAVEFQGLYGAALRAGMVYSSRAWHTQSLFQALRAGTCPPLCGERAYVSPIHAEDLADAVIAASENASRGMVLNIVDDAPLRIGDLLREGARAAGVKPPGALPSFLLRMVVGKDAYRMLGTSCRASNARAKEALPWRPRHPSLAERIADEYALWQRACAEPAGAGPP
ncbi:MAG TPA: hypothetical protein DCM87_20115 [Planctomycetes bacterium]|nr:hypothetical protein [Planctomycetota bacterium]